MEVLKTMEVTKQTLVTEVDTLKAQGYRFVTITCLELDKETLEFLYHFDKELDLKHLRLQSLKNASMPSISPSFFAAFLVENEIMDLFGTTFDNLVLDFGGSLYLDEDDDIKATPFCKYGINQANPTHKTRIP